MKSLLLIICALQLCFTTFSQSCLPNGRQFHAQFQIDEFKTNYPNCTKIIGGVIIGPYTYDSDINNLDGLSNITTIGSYLKIHNNPLLESLEGLNNIDTIGEWIIINNNNALANLSGLQKLKFIGEDFKIRENSNLSSLYGIENLNFIGGSFALNENNALTFIETPEELNVIGRHLSISNCSSLISLEGMDNIYAVKEGIHISDCPLLTDLDGWGNLIKVGGISFLRLDALETIEALAGITSLDSNVIYNQEIWISYCSSLSSLSGIDNIDPLSIKKIVFHHNPLLSECDVLSICGYLGLPDNNSFFNLNASGCNSIQEAELSCNLAVEDFEKRNKIIIFPNPSNNRITISLPNDVDIEEVIIVNSYGQAVFASQQGRETIDVSKLAKGIYILKVRSSEKTLIKRIVIN